MSDTSVPETRPPIGFMQWLDSYGRQTARPYDYELVETWDRFLGVRCVIDPSAMHPMTNVANLYWKPVGGWPKRKDRK